MSACLFCILVELVGEFWKMRAAILVQPLQLVIADLSTVFKHQRINLLLCILQILEASSIERGVGLHKLDVMLLGISLVILYSVAP